MSAKPEIKTLPVRFIDNPRTANAFLIKGECNVLIDSGPKQSKTNCFLFQELEKNGVEPGNVKPVLFTHGHMDHVGGANVLQDSGADLYIGELDATMLLNHSETFNSDILPLARAKGLDLSVAEEYYRNEMPEEVTSVKLISAGDTLKFGDTTIKVIDLSGHTYGSVGFYLEQENTLFGGDAVCGAGPWQGSLPLIYSIDKYIDTAKRLQQSGIGRILLAHEYFVPGLEPNCDQSGAGLSLLLSTTAEMAERLRDEVSKYAGRQDIPFMQVCDQILGAMPEEFELLPIEKLAMPDMTLRTLIHALRDYAQWAF